MEFFQVWDSELRKNPKARIFSKSDTKMLKTEALEIKRHPRETNYVPKKLSDKKTSSKYFLQNWHSAKINDTEQYFCMLWKICCSQAYFSDQSSSWSSSKSKNQLRIRKRMLYLCKLVGCFIHYQDLETPGSLNTICKTFLILYHLSLLWWRGI